MCEVSDVYKLNKQNAEASAELELNWMESRVE